LTWSLGVLSVLFLVARSVAGEPCAGSLGRELQCTRCATVPCCCPDDYCRKPMPRLCWPVAGQFYRCAPGNDQASVSGVR